MPRVFEPVGGQARGHARRANRRGEESPRLGRIAKDLGHWAIPQEEELHLSATVHSTAS